MRLPATLAELLVHELKDLHDAGRRLRAALPKLAMSAHDREVQLGLIHQLHLSDRRLERLEHGLRLLGASARGQTCEVVRGLVDSLRRAVDPSAAPRVKDAALIAVLQRIGHYSIAACGTARAFAESLGHTEVAQMLQEILDEESETERRLGILAETLELRTTARPENAEPLRSRHLNGEGGRLAATPRRRRTPTG